MHPKHPEVIKLRRKGMSYREIALAVGVSKNSVSRWCQGLKLPLSVQKIIQAKTKAAHDQLLAYNELRKQTVQNENRKTRKEATAQINSLSKKELRLIGAALYWAEGWNKDVTGKGHSVCFVNSNPDMIKLYLRFLREIIEIPEERLRLAIHIYPNIKADFAINYWSKITDIPKERFNIVTQISGASRGKRPQNSLPCGTLKLDIHNREIFFKIKGWIDGLIKQSNLR